MKDILKEMKRDPGRIMEIMKLSLHLRDKMTRLSTLTSDFFRNEEFRKVWKKYQQMTR